MSATGAPLSRPALLVCLCLLTLLPSLVSPDSGLGNPLAKSCTPTHRYAGCKVQSAVAKVLVCICRQVYVSTIDGGLTALDEQGHTVWSYKATNPLFFSSLSHMEVRAWSRCTR